MTSDPGRIIIIFPWTATTLDGTYWLGINRDKTSHGEWILPEHQGESVQHHSSRETGRGRGVESAGRTKGGKSIITSWMKCFPRPSCDPDFALWATCPWRRPYGGIRGDGGKIWPSLPALSISERDNVHTQRNGPPGQAGEGRGTWQSWKKSLHLGYTGQGRILPKQQILSLLVISLLCPGG